MTLAVRVRRVPGPPVVAARLWLRAGSRLEEIPGQSYITGRLLNEGSRRRTWDRIAAEAEDRGMAIHSAGTAETLVVSIDALAEDRELALDWLAELALEPAFPEDRLQWICRQTAAELESLLDRPEVRTARGFLDQLYHPHPYCRPIQGDADSLVRLTAADCAALHHRALDWGGCLTVTGDVDEDAVQRQLRELFGDLIDPDRESPPQPAVPPPAGLAENRREVALHSAEQAYLYAGHLTVPCTHPQAPALDIAAVVLGAGAGLSGRLPTRIREQEGLAYSVDVATTAGAGIDAGRLVVFVGTSPDTVAGAERVVREELHRLVDGGVEEDELEEARSYLIGREPFRRETARQWAEVLAEAELYGLDSDRPRRVVARLRSLTRDDVEEAVRQWIRPDEVKVTVGLPAG
ncbi:MAG: pitrilysin family protein [Thermoanaerobaculia bacterium]